MSPRILLFTSHDIWIRQAFVSGALDPILGPDTYVIGSSGKTREARSLEALSAKGNYLGTVTDPRPEVERRASKRGGLFGLDYDFLEGVLTTHLSGRSNSIRKRLDWSYTPRQRRLLRLAALPGVRQLLHRVVMRRTGLHPEITAHMREVEPDLVLVVTGGYDSLARDAIRSARAAGLPSVAVVPNWDALSDKAGFIVRPDYLGVWGEQSAEQAQRIHGFSPEQVEILGAPGFEPYFRYEPGSRPSPFPFRYVLFAGATRAFDELTPIRKLDAAVAELGWEGRIVYRPHPYRGIRKEPDFVDEDRLEHVVLDPQMREIYLRHFEAYKPGGKNVKMPLPALDYYPPLLEHAELVICPLSTMMLEAALAERRVLVPAYHDGLHDFSPGLLKDLEHFRGLDEVEGIDYCQSEEALVERFVELLREPHPPRRSLREAMRHYVHFDERRYGERLAALLEGVAAGPANSG